LECYYNKKIGNEKSHYLNLSDDFKLLQQLQKKKGKIKTDDDSEDFSINLVNLVDDGDIFVAANECVVFCDSTENH